MKRILFLTGILIAGISDLSFGQNYESEFQIRANQITSRLADTAAIRSFGSLYFNQEFQGPGPTLPDPEKHVWPVVIARLKKYGNADTAGNRVIAKYKDRSPFHFTYVGMARIMSQFPEATNMVVHKNAYLTRVWNRTDSYNPWTGEGTENHISMNKTSGYLYAQHSLGNALFPQAASRLAETKLWLRWFARNLYKMGNSEWNSSTYESYNLVGWLNLFDFAADPEVRDIARAVLDYYSCEMALHCSQGYTGGAESRGNITGWGSGEDYMSWIWFGYQARLMGQNFWLNKEFSQAMHAAASGYRPPMIAVKLARKEIPVPAFFRYSRPDYGQNIRSFTNQTFYAGKGFTLGSAMLPVVGWANGNTQYCNWKLVGNITPGVNVNSQIVMGGSRYFNQKDGKGKTPWDQYVQNKNVFFQLHKIPSNAADIINTDTLLFTTPSTGWRARWLADFDQRFPNDNDRSNPVGFSRGSLSRNISYITYPKNRPSGGAVSNLFRNNIFFVQLENVFLAIRSVSQLQPSAPSDESSSRSYVSDAATQGSLCGLILEAGSATDFSGFTAFQDSVIAKTSLDRSLVATENKVVYRNLAGDTLVAGFTENGPAASEPLYDWGFGPTTQQLYQTTPPFLQPTWQGGAGRGKIPTLFVNSVNQGYGQNNWPVFEGPGLILKDSTLLLTTDSSGLTVFYQVDFTGNQPAFSSGILSGVKDPVQGKMESLDLFPNPTAHEVTVRAKGITSGKKVNITVFSVKGSLVWSGNEIPYSTEGIKIPAHNFGVGVYQVILKSENRTFGGRLILDR